MRHHWHCTMWIEIIMVLIMCANVNRCCIVALEILSLSFLDFGHRRVMDIWVHLVTFIPHMGFIIRFWSLSAVKLH